MVYGIDEVGRGCLAGPVTAACVAFQYSDAQCAQQFFKHAVVLADSKALNAAQRQDSAAFIRAQYIWGIGWAYPHEIDARNIHHATLLAMQRAFHKAFSYSKSVTTNERSTPYALVDGLFTPDIPIAAEARVKGDNFIPQIQAASIVAKVARDAFMTLVHRDMPEYKFETNKGYPTKAHKHALHEHGIRSHMHRKSFCKKLL